MQPGSTTSTPRSDSAAVRDNLADIRAKLSFQLNSGTSSSYLDNNNNNNNNTSFNQNGSFSRFRQRPLFTFGNATGAHRDPTHQTMGGTPQRGMSSDRPQTPVGRSPSTQASAQYLLSTQRELERVQRDKHEWERRCMELEASNAELTNELEYLSGCMSQQQHHQGANEEGSSTYPLNSKDDAVGPGIDLRASNASNISSPPAHQQQHQPTAPGLSQEEVAKLHARIASLTASLDEVSTERDSLLSQHQATGNQLEVLMNEYEKEKAAKDLQVSALEKELEKVNQSCGKALRAAEQMQARHENEIAEMEAELLEAREELDNVTSAHAAAAANNSDSTNAKSDALQQQVYLLTQKLKSAEANSSSLEEELSDVRSQLVSSERLQLELEEDQRTLEEEVTVAKKLIEELTTKNTTLNDTYTSLVDTQPLCEQLEVELKRLQNQLDAQIASSNAREKQLETVMAEQEEEFKEQLNTLESQRELDQQAIADLQGQLESVMAEAAEAAEKLQQQQAAATAATTNNDDEDEDSITSKKLAEDESSAIAWLTGQLAEMTESMEGVCTTSPAKDKNAATTNINDDDDPMTVALEAAEKAQQLLQHSSYDSQTELQNAIEDCARALQERQHTHLSMHKENLKTRELKKKEWMNRKIEDVEAAYVAKIDGLESMLEELQEQLVAHDAGDDDELANAKEECKQHKAACEALEMLIKEQEAQLEQLTKEASSSTRESSAKAAQYEEEIAMLRASLEERTLAYDDLKKAQVVLEQQIDSEDQDRAANSSARDAALMSRLTGLTEEYEAVVAERDAFLEEMEDLKESLAEKEEALEEADKQLQQQQEKSENTVQPAANAVVSSSSSPSSPSAAWPSSSSVLGADIDHKLPIDTLEALIAECGHFEDLTFSKPHVYDHTCWAFDAFHLDDPQSEAGYGPHLLLHICCSTYRDIVDPDWSLEDGSIAEMDTKATSMGLPPMNTFLSFIATVYNGYHHRSSVPYHNRTHAADIVQMTILLVRNALLPKHVAASASASGDAHDEDTPTYLWDVLSPLDRFALLIAALTHDYNHPGKKNVFLSRIHDPVAVRYSGKSVLENHHATATFSICQDATTDITEHMTTQQRDNFHNQVTTMILNTDMTLHGKHLEEFAQKAVYPLFTGSDECTFNEVTNPKDRLDAMCTLLHAADVGNSARPFHIARKWGVAVRDEFFAQGAVEKLLGYEISFGCDEELDIKSGGIGPDQLSFIDNMILPFWHVLVKRYGVEAPGCEDLLEEYHSLLDGILSTQQAILDEALEVSSDPIRGEDVSIPLTFDMENAEAFAWRGAYGLQMMVDALQANRLMWLKMTAPQHQSRFSIDAPADKASLKIVALNNAASVADSAKEEEESVQPTLSSTPKKLSPTDNDGPCSDCDIKHNALVEMQKALKAGQQDVEDLLANKAMLLKQLSQAQEDLEAAAAANAAPPPAADVRPALEEQHQARVKQLKEMIMNANQKKNELEVENKELKRRVSELEASATSTATTTTNSTPTPLATTTTTTTSSSPNANNADPTSAASSRPVSRYGVQGSMGMGGGSSSSEDDSPSSDDEGISTTARRQSF